MDVLYLDVLHFAGVGHLLFPKHPMFRKHRMFELTPCHALRGKVFSLSPFEGAKGDVSSTFQTFRQVKKLSEGDSNLLPSEGFFALRKVSKI